MALPIVLLHAFPLSSAMWEPVRGERLGGLEIITPDFRGAGGVPLGDATPSLDVLADDVAALLDARGIDRAIIGGLSMGGYVTMAFARRHSRRAAAVVLADTKAGADAEAARANRLRLAETLTRDGHVGVLLDEVLPTLLGATTKAERPDVVASVRALIEATPPSAAAWWQRAMAARPDSLDTLRRLEVPALVIVGDEDALAPRPAADAMVEALPDSWFVEIAGAGHLSALEAPAEFALALARFAADVTSAG